MYLIDFNGLRTRRLRGIGYGRSLCIEGATPLTCVLNLQVDSCCQHNIVRTYSSALICGLQPDGPQTRA